MNDQNYERRLSIVETQISSISSTIERQESNSKVIFDVERIVLEMRGDVKNMFSELQRVRKDHEILEKDTSMAQEASRKEISETVNTIVGAIGNMTSNFNDAVQQLSSAYMKKIHEDIEPRLSAVEKHNWRFVGAVTFGAFLIGILVPIFLSFRPV